MRLACLYNSRVYILIANKHVVQDIKAALPFVFNVDKYGDLEEKVISTMSDSKLLSLARSHEQDSLGVEIMQYVNSCFEICVGQNLQISRLNASALDNVTSVHENNDEFFRRSTAFRYYDYGLTGRINKVDGLFVFRVFSQNRSVYRWLLNLEVDGQDKTKESFSCAMKMWQSVDINRARTPDAITFTLRANIYKMHTHRFNDANKILRRLFKSNKKKTTPAFRNSGVANTNDQDRHSTDDDDNDLDSSSSSDSDDLNTDAANAMPRDTRTKKNLITSKDALQMQLETAIYFLRTYANAHVYFVCEMLRFICREGKLYNELYADYEPGDKAIISSGNTKRKGTRPLYDIHCFLGAFTVDTPNEIRLQANQPVPYEALDAQGGTSCRWKSDNSGKGLHKKLPVCTVPSFTHSTSHIWQNWTARVQCINLSLPNNIEDMPLRFLCVQRVKMHAALNIMREESTKTTNGKGWDLFSQSKVAQEFHGIWYVQDIVDFLLGTQSYLMNSWRAEKKASFVNKVYSFKAGIFSWEDFDSMQVETELGLTPDTDKADIFLEQLPNTTDAEKKAYVCYEKLKQVSFCAEKYNRLVGRSTSKLKNDAQAKALYQAEFYPKNQFTSQTENGFFYVLQGVADEMLNSIFSLFSVDLQGKSASMRIRWHEANLKHHIDIQPILKTVKLIRRDIDARVTDRKAFLLKESDHWELQTGLPAIKGLPQDEAANFLPQSSWAQTNNATLNALMLRSMNKTLPHIEHDFSIYVQRQNIPGANLFLRALRVYNYIAARELWTQVQNTESMKTKFESVLGIFPVGVQSELINLLRTLQQDDTMLAIEIQKILQTIPPYSNWSNLPRSMTQKPLGLLGTVMQILKRNYSNRFYCDLADIPNTNYYRHLLQLQTHTQRAPARNLQNIVNNKEDNNQVLGSKKLDRLQGVMKAYNAKVLMVEVTPLEKLGGYEDYLNATASQAGIIQFLKDELNVNVNIMYDSAEKNLEILVDFNNFMTQLEQVKDQLFFRKWCMPGFLQQYQVHTLLNAVTQTMWQSTVRNNDSNLYFRAINTGVISYAFKIKVRQVSKSSSSDFVSVDLLQDSDDEDDDDTFDVAHSTPVLLMYIKRDGNDSLQMFSENTIDMPVNIEDLRPSLALEQMQFFSHSLESNSFYSLLNNEDEFRVTLRRWFVYFNLGKSSWKFKASNDITIENMQCVDLTATPTKARCFWGIFERQDNFKCVVYLHAGTQTTGPVCSTLNPRILSALNNNELFVLEDNHIRRYKLNFRRSAREQYAITIALVGSIPIITTYTLQAFSLLNFENEVVSHVSMHDDEYKAYDGFDVTRVEQEGNELKTYTFKFRIPDSNVLQLSCTCSLVTHTLSADTQLVKTYAQKYWSINQNDSKLCVDVWDPTYKNNHNTRVGCLRHMPLIHRDDSNLVQYSLAIKSKKDSEDTCIASAMCVGSSDECFQDKNGIREFEHFTTLHQSKTESDELVFARKIYESKQVHDTSDSKGLARMQEFETVMRFYAVSKWPAVFTHNNSKLYLRDLAEQLVATSWLHMKNCYSNNAWERITPNLQPVSISDVSKADWLSQLLVLHQENDLMHTPAIDAAMLDKHKLALMSPNIIVHFTSTKWRDTLICARILLKWFHFAVLQERALTHSYRAIGSRSGIITHLARDSTRSVTLMPLEVTAKQERLTFFGNMHKTTAKALHRHVALQMFAPVSRGQQSVKIEAERGLGGKKRAWNPGVQNSAVDSKCLHEEALQGLQGCVFESFVSMDGNTADTSTIAHDYAYLLVFAQFRMLMQYAPTPAYLKDWREQDTIDLAIDAKLMQYTFNGWRARVSKRQKKPFADIDKSILALRLNYFIFMRTIVSDLSKQNLRNACISSDQSMRSKGQLDKESRADKLESMKLQWIMQMYAQKILHVFAEHIAMSIHHSMLIHFKWKRLLIRRIFIARLEYAVQSGKQSRSFFKMECSTVQEGDLSTLAQNTPRGPLREFELMATLQQNIQNFGLKDAGSFAKYSQAIIDNPNLSKITVGGDIPAIYSLLDFLLNRHENAGQRAQTLTLTSEHVEVWKYLRSMQSASVIKL